LTMQQKTVPDTGPNVPNVPDMLTVAELAALLNTLLEAERAGAKVLTAFLDEYPRESPAWKQLREVQHDEADNCARLTQAIRDAGGVASHATGDFLDKALAIQGRVPRLAFLNRGQAWVARKIAAALPRIPPGTTASMLDAMHASHLANIAACDLMIETLDNARA